MPKLPGQVLVSVPVAELRKRPAHAAELLTQALLGEELHASRPSADGKWFKVRRWDGYTGWIRSWSVTPLPAEAPWASQGGQGVRVVTRSALLTERPGPAGGSVLELPFGARLPEAAVVSSSGWARHVLPDGREGWLERKRLATVLRCSRGPGGVLRAAREFAGAPYLWGGITPWGCDCSGFVQSVFLSCGVPLPRDARDQLDTLQDRLVESRAHAFKPADLLFFGSSRRNVSHVAISQGGSRFIHAYGYVREGNLKEGAPGFLPDLARLFLTAARPLRGQKKG